MFLWIITIGFLTGYGILIFYYYRHWKNLKEYKPDTTTKEVVISVIIAARNEEKNLPVLLTSLQRQTYSRHLFEVIIVDDFSTDNTAAVVNQFAWDNLKIIQPDGQPDASSKKKAIEAGVKKAQGELLVITDADCAVTEQWLQTIASFYADKQAVFIAAPVQFHHNNSILQLLQAMDFMILQGITAASVSAGFHSMCNGANLAYTKLAFMDVNGFAGIDKVASGDDMLLMHKIAQQHPNRVHYLKNKKAIVATQPMQTWKDFIMQRRRWASKTLYYDDYTIPAVLTFVYLFNLTFFVLLVVALWNPYNWWLFGFYLVLKTVIELPFVYSVARFYNEEKLIKFFPFFQPLHIMYLVSVGLLSQLGKYKWKDRTTK